MKVSIITAVYNAKNTIAHTIRSVLEQTHPQIEYIVLDGASTDGTTEIIQEELASQITRFVSEKDNGLYDALNKGIKLATGEIIGFLHADDCFYSKHVISDIAQNFDNQTQALYGDLVYISKSNPNSYVRYWRAGKYKPWKLRTGWMPPHPTLFLRKTIYEDVGGFNLGYKISADYDFMIRVLKTLKTPPKYLPEILLKMQLGGISNNSLENIWKKMFEDFLIIRQHKLGGGITLLLKNFQKIPQFW